jgi:hypothetical protein
MTEPSTIKRINLYFSITTINYLKVHYFKHFPYLTYQGSSLSGPRYNWFRIPPDFALKESIATLSKAGILENLFKDWGCNITWSSTKPTIQTSNLE